MLIMPIPMIGIAIEIVIVIKSIWIVIEIPVVIDTHLESVFFLFLIQKTQLIKEFKDKEKVLNWWKLLSISGCISFFVVKLHNFFTLDSIVS